METNNYETILEEISRQISQWKKRNITVLGRITIVKSLLLSKLTFLILNLPDPPEDFVKQVSRMMYNFIWKGVDRVSRNQMIQDYENGGLRIIYALKVTWIRRVLNAGNTDWAYIFIKSSNINHILDIEGGSVDILTLLDSESPNKFWYNVFTAWSTVIKSRRVQNRTDLLKNTLWFNNRIRVGKQTIYYRHWVKNGVRFVIDVVKTNGGFLSLDEFKNKYNVKTNFLEYGAVINAIKRSCNHILDKNTKNVPNPLVPYNFEFVLRDKKGSRRLYESLVLSREVKQNYLRKWELELNKTYSNKQWSIFFLLPLKCTIDVKLRWFQFRIIHKILGVNSFLAKIGIKDSNLCTFCKVKEETIKHICL